MRESSAIVAYCAARLFAFQYVGHRSHAVSCYAYVHATDQKFEIGMQRADVPLRQCLQCSGQDALGRPRRTSQQSPARSSDMDEDNAPIIVAASPLDHVHAFQL